MSNAWRCRSEARVSAAPQCWPPVSVASLGRLSTSTAKSSSVSRPRSRLRGVCGRECLSLSDAIDACALTTETLLKDTTTTFDVLRRRRTKEDDDDEEDFVVDERLANVLDRVSGLSERYQTVLERTRRQKTMLLENARRCDVDVVRANEGDECDFQAVLKTEAYVKR